VKCAAPSERTTTTGRILRAVGLFPVRQRYFTYFSYDLLDRPLNEKRPLNEADAAGTAPYCTTCKTTQYKYAYPRTTIIDANTKATVNLPTPSRQPVQVTDANTIIPTTPTILLETCLRRRIHRAIRQPTHSIFAASE